MNRQAGTSTQIVDGKVKLNAVLCATDLAKPSEYALAQAAELAQAWEAKLYVAHIVERWDSRYDILFGDLVKKLEAQAREKVEQELAHLQKTSPVAIEVIVKEGKPSHELLKIAKEKGVDLIVCGTHGHKPLEDLLLGSKAEALLRYAPCSVLVARPIPSADFTNIAVAVDFSPCSRTGLDWAVDLARREKLVQVSVLHTYEVPTGHLEAGMSHEVAAEKMKALSQEQFASFIASLPQHSGIALKPILREGSPVESIVELANQERANLIVLGTHGHQLLASFFLGNVALGVIRKANISVLAVKSPQHQQSLWDALFNF